MKHEMLQRHVGWFLLLGAGLLVAAMLLASIRSDMFADKFTLHLQPPTAAAFFKGQSVRFQGFVIGHVDQISLLNKGVVHIRLKLLERYHSMIHQGAALQVVKEGLIGEQIASITMGDVKKPIIRDGESINYVSKASIDQLLIEMKPAIGHANQLLRELASLARWMNDPNGDLRIALAQMRDASEGLHGDEVHQSMQALTETLQKLRDLLVSFEDKQLAAQLADSLQQTARILKYAEPLSKSIGKEGPETLRRLNVLMKQVDILSGSLTHVSNDLAKMTPELPRLSREARDAIHEMKALVKSLRQTWLAGSGKMHDRSDVQDTTGVMPPVMDLRP